MLTLSFTIGVSCIGHLLETRFPREAASLVISWLRVHLPVQGTWTRSLVREGSTCHRATKLVHHSYRACEPQLLKPIRCRARALQQEKPPQREAHAPRLVAPTRHNWRKTTCSNEDPAQPNMYIYNKLNFYQILLVKASHKPIFKR